jgi:ribosomal protein S4E
MTKDDLQTILMESMRHNSDNNITGILLYDQGSFCQVLEGSKKEVLSIFKKIKKDKRHFNVVTISEKEIEYREFSAWSMRFVNLDLYDRQMINGYQNISGNNMNWAEINSSLAKSILMQFKNF